MTTYASPMPIFFFDSLCGEQFIRDDEGLSFEGQDEAKRQARRALGEMARDCVPNIDAGSMAVWVRDENGVIFTAILRLEMTP